MTEWSDYEDVVKTWRSELLTDVKQLPVSGTPGTCVVFRPHSVAVVSGCGAQNVSMAAGSLGRGRVFAIAHNGYVNSDEIRGKPNVRRLFKNVYRWLSRGAYGGEDDVLDLKTVGKAAKGKNNSSSSPSSDFTGKKILLWSGGEIPGVETAKVREFVENGGGLIHAMCPWGWLQLQKPKKKLEDMPIYEVLSAAGIAYTEGYCKTDGPFKVDLSDEGHHLKATENISYVLQLAKDKENLAKYGESLCQGIAGAPEALKLELLPGIKEVFCCHKGLLQTPSCRKPMKGASERCLVMLCDLACDLGAGVRAGEGGEGAGAGDEDAHRIACVEEFLGACGEGPTVCAEREFSAKLKNFHSTGLYARPGAKITVEVLSGADTLKDGWKLRIGAHTDNNTGLSVWKRWPVLCKRFPLTTANLKVISPYGGLVYLENPEFKNRQCIRVKIEGGIEAPRFDITEPDAEAKWLASRDALGPWTDLCGRHISFTVPSSCVRRLENPSEVLQVWDRVVAAHSELRGNDPSTIRHQWVVADAQPVAGYMHAGYPIVTMMDVVDPDTPNNFLLNPEHVMSDGCWGMFHELGHNFQRPAWTFRGCGEVTCNIFTLHAMEVIANKQPWIHEWLGKQLKKIQRALESEKPYDVWVKDPGVGLGIYAQLQHSFGWDAYKKVFAHYEALDEKKQPKGDDDRLKYWVQVFSETVGYNLCPLYEFWGFTLPDSLNQSLKQPPFLPDDEMTQMQPKRVEFLTAIYQGLVRQP